jgi:hypothetical protein
MNETRRFWIPHGVPEHLQIALSIPGDPPKTVYEHWDRREMYLADLAEEAEANLNRRQIFETVYSIVPDSNIFLLSLDHTPADFMYALMQPDLVCGSRFTEDENLGPWVDDNELQESARELGL